ncbi:MAG: ammonium transporter [Deltaproteobacteria bacterium]|nr:ammonium transporter [Deltaproteobacteria bacterium]MBW2382261.1 ammonium transporter [Deltaproteobacteria bacterium]MBW2695558.1 ammonium transporter [Deltaproteobacteria bacterium]
MQSGLRRWLRAGATFATPLALAAAAPATARAEDVANGADTAWILTCSALVLLMTLPGLALFYGGLVRVKNILSVLMQCMMAAGLVGVLWVVAGYSLAFGEGNKFIGDFSMVMLSGITPDTVSGTIPTYVFVMFQGMFAIITPALMLGAFAERMRFSAYLAFISIWLFVVYIPLAHMVWGGGWIGADLGALDFAGGLVVHMSSGFSALVACLFLGPRRGYGKEPMPPNNLVFTMIGASLLWVGWFGFNAGSQLAADGTAGLAFLTTQTAAATAVLFWAAIEWIHRGRPTQLGAATGAVAGLVAITPACAFVGPGGAIAIGAGAAFICYAAVTIIKPKLGYDDSLDVFGVHGIGGMWGAIATGLFLAPWGMQEGVSQGSQILKQLISVGFTALYASAMAFSILFVLKLVMGDLRVSAEDEHQGLDVSEHSETAYGQPT